MYKIYFSQFLFYYIFHYTPHISLRVENKIKTSINSHYWDVSRGKILILEHYISCDKVWRFKRAQHHSSDVGKWMLKPNSCPTRETSYSLPFSFSFKQSVERDFVTNSSYVSCKKEESFRIFTSFFILHPILIQQYINFHLLSMIVSF